MNRRSFLQGATALFTALMAGPKLLEEKPRFGPTAFTEFCESHSYTIGVDHGRPGGDWAGYVTIDGKTRQVVPNADADWDVVRLGGITFEEII